MKPKTSRNIDVKLVIALAVIALAIFSAVYYTSYCEITDASVLSVRTSDALKDTKSYRFAISTNLSMSGGDAEMINGEGCVDCRNKKLRTTMTMMNSSMEMVVIGDMAYIRESNGSWQTQELGKRSVWDYDQLGQQRSILLNATNVTMRKGDNGWILDVIPDKETIIEQMKKTSAGLETIKEEELKNFTIRYWIEKDSYHITRIENKVEIEMNIKGMVTPVRLNNFIDFHDYNEKMDIEAPI